MGIFSILPAGAVMSIVRHLLTFGGGIIVQQGYMDAAQTEALIGAVITIIGIFWSAAKNSGISVKIERQPDPGTEPARDPFKAGQ